MKSGGEMGARECLNAFMCIVFRRLCIERREYGGGQSGTVVDDSDLQFHKSEVWGLELGENDWSERHIFVGDVFHKIPTGWKHFVQMTTVWLS